MAGSEESMAAVKSCLRLSDVEAKRVTAIVFAGLALHRGDRGMTARWIARPAPEYGGLRPMELLSDENFKLFESYFLRFGKEDLLCNH